MYIWWIVSFQSQTKGIQRFPVLCVLLEDRRKMATGLPQGYKSLRCAHSICALGKVESVFGVQHFLSLWLWEECPKVYRIYLVFVDCCGLFRRRCSPASTIWAVSDFSFSSNHCAESHLHSTCIPHPAAVQPSHTVWGGDSSLPSSSTPSCRVKDQSFTSLYVS